MSNREMKRGDIVLFQQGIVTYVGMVFKVSAAKGGGDPMYICKFYNRSNRMFGRNIWKFPGELQFIGSMPEGAEWDVKLAP